MKKYVINSKVFESLDGIEKATNFFIKIYEYRRGDNDIIERIEDIVSRQMLLEVPQMESARAGLKQAISELSSNDFKKYIESGIAPDDWGEYIIEKED